MKLNVMALTGGIATGKSTSLKIFQGWVPEMVVFDADHCVGALYEDPQVLDELVANFGQDIMSSSTDVDKAYLRQRAFADESVKRVLEQIFHPRVLQECLALLEKTAMTPASRLFVADIPLLFESGFDFGQSLNLLVATSRKTQVRRLKNRNAWDDDTVDGVLNSQMPIEAKLALADVVFWNEGPLEILQAQCLRFIQSLEIGTTPQ
jgi:dephospho-CoA kinase